MTTPTPDPSLLGEFSWTVEDLATRFAPQWRHRNKLVIASLATPPGTNHEGSVKVSRWGPSGTPLVVKTCSVAPQAGFFQYRDEADSRTHWHMNFADPYLFGYGEGPLLAQDELQIAEHPCLASLATAIEAATHGQEGLTRSTQGVDFPTPVLVEGAPRRCALDTSNIYGDRFSEASAQTVTDATTVLEPPTLSNIVALAALPPVGGRVQECTDRGTVPHRLHGVP